MIRFDIHTIDSAPERSKSLLQELRSTLGMIPNLAATMAGSPELLEGFLRIRSILCSGTFLPAEVQVLALTNAYENGCTYCMALHSVLAAQDKVSPESVAALRAGRAPLEPRLRALSEFSRALVRTRGHVTAADLAAFVGAGFTPGQALEAVLGVAVSILPNFAHHLTQCPVDDAFVSQVWAKPAA